MWQAKEGAISAIDFSALTEPVTRAQLSEYRRERASAQGAPAAVLRALPVVVFGGAILLMASVFVGAAARTPDGLVLSILVVVVGAGAGVVAWLLAAGRTAREYRLNQFAAANSLVYDPDHSRPRFPGAIFDVGHSRTIVERLLSVDGTPIDLGNYRYATGSGKNRRTHAWGYLAIRLPRRLPHMVLDAKENNFFGSNLPVAFGRAQRLSLEGDFDDYFTLYCPREYERDALYVFAPDLMALLIDESGSFDVEIVDDWMFVYAGGSIELDSPAVLGRLFRIVDTVGAKASRRSERYADDRSRPAGHAGSPSPTARLAHNQIAPSGRRLRRGMAPLGVAMVAVVGAAVVFSLWGR